MVRFVEIDSTATASHRMGDSDVSVDCLRFGILGAAAERLGDNLVLLGLSLLGDDSGVVGDEEKIIASTEDTARVGKERSFSSAAAVADICDDGGDFSEGANGRELDTELVKIGVGLISVENIDAASHLSLPFLASALVMAKF